MIALATGDVGSWNMSSRTFAGGIMNGSPIGTPGTRMPAASTSTRRFTRAGCRSASSAPSQPPSDRPTTSTRSSRRAQHVQRVEDQVLDRLDRVEALGGAEPRVHGEDDAAAPGEKVVDRHPPERAGAVEVEERRAGAALEQLDAAAVDGERTLVTARGDGFHHAQLDPRHPAGRRSTTAVTETA